MPRCTNLIYNNITLALVKTNRIHFTPQYSNDGIDYLWTDVTIDVNCILNPEETSYVIEGGAPDPTTGETPTVTMQTIRHYLMQPRFELQFGFADNFLIQSPAAGFSVDPNNGPTPLTCDIMRIDGNKTWHIHYVIKCAIIECPDDNCQNNHVLISNRFSQQQTINREYYTEIVTRGEAYFRVDLLEFSGQVADQFRNKLLPTAPLYFQRESVHFGINTEGNRITYECRDVEKSYDLGDTGQNGGFYEGTYITHVEGVYTLQTIASPNGVATGQAVVTVNVKIWGGRPASNWILTQIAFQLISNKVDLQVQQNQYPRQTSILQDLVNRYVEVTIALWVGPQAGNVAVIKGAPNIASLQNDSIFPDQMGKNPQPWQDKGTRGSSGYYLLSQALMDACQCQNIPQEQIDAVAGVQDVVPQTGGPPIVTVAPALRPGIPLTLTKYSFDNAEFQFSDARISSRYETSMGVIQCPIGIPYNSAATAPPDQQQPGGFPTSVIVNVSNPTTRRIVDWTVERYGHVPNIPAAILSDTNQVLLSQWMTLDAVPVLEDGQTPVFRVTGQYIYAMLVDRTQIPVVPFDEIQWVNYTYGTFKIDTTPGGSNAVHGYIDPPGNV